MPIIVKIYNKKAENVGEIKLSSRVFGVKANDVLVHQSAVAQMANERQVLAHTKGRSEVRGGGRKPWRQKGTGRARAGSSRSPIWKGGGVTFGPLSTRNFKKNINKKMRQKALLMVLSDRVGSGNMTVIDKISIDEYKTKKVDEIVRGLEKAREGERGEGGNKVKSDVDQKVNGEKNISTIKDSKQKDEKKKKDIKKRSVLVINDKKDEKTKYSFRNLAGVKFINLDNINILDLLKYKDLILTKDCVKILEEKYK